MKTIYRKNILAIAVSSAISCATCNVAIAQESKKSTEQKVEDQIEVIEVKGIRSQYASAQEIKRLATTVKDVITSDDIGSLPDKSVTEALQRVPGVTIERFESSSDSNHFSSEGAGVVVRGLKRIRSEINGRDSFSASASGGGLSYADIPGELLGRIEVVKNSTADLVAGGVAGTVNLVTRKPFDSEDMILYGQTKASYGDHRKEATPAVTLMFSNVWELDSGKFGFLIGGTESEFKDRGDGVGVDNYYERSSTARETENFGNWGTAIAGMEDQTLYTPASVAIRTSDSDRNRQGIVSALQWSNPKGTVEVTAEYIYSDASRDWAERVVQYGEQGFLVNPNNMGVVNGSFDDDGFMTGGQLNTNWMLVGSRFNQVNTKIKDLSLHVKVNPNKNLQLDFDIQKIDSTNSVKDWSYTSNMQPDAGVDVGVEFELTNGTPNHIHYVGNTAQPQTDLQSFLGSKMDHEEDNEADSTSFAFDLEYKIDEGWISSIQAGAYASKKSQLSSNSVWNWQAVSPSWDWNTPWASLQEAGSYVLHPELFESFTFNANDFFGGGILNGNQTFQFPVMSGVKNYHAYGKTLSSDFSFNGPDLADRANTNGSYLDSETTDTSETRLELYLQANYVFDDLDYPIRGDFGLRYISWQVESTGGVLFPQEGFARWNSTNLIIDENFPGVIPFANSAQTPRTTEKGDKYTKLLPSFNLSMEMSEEHIMRVAISKNVYFPIFSNFKNYQQISMNSVKNYDQTEYVAINFSGETGNPHIEPEEAVNMDLSLEWYFSDAGSLNVNLFRKELDNLIRKRLFVRDITNVNAGDQGDENVTMPVAFQTDTNEGSGSISGFELSYVQFYDFLPGAWSGLGLSANYTFIAQSGVEDKIGFGDGSDGDGGRNSFRAFKNLDLPGYSDDTFNLALMFEKYDISARMAYSWRSEYLLTRRDADLFAPVIAKATGQLDASISYQINENFRVGFEASNLFDEVIETEMMYEQNGRQTPRSHFKTDRRFSLYLSASF
ncbi:MAG: TonB-dependent receptor [Alteromonadaceae bacterium]|nr:TonB-dependent receptor [Alteromonadaceae bacterium]